VGQEQEVLEQEAEMAPILALVAEVAVLAAMFC
jgi:hypothetical protein